MSAHLIPVVLMLAAEPSASSEAPSSESLEWACDVGEASACRQLGLQRVATGERQGAWRAMLRACELGRADACTDAARMATDAGLPERSRALLHHVELLHATPADQPWPVAEWTKNRGERTAWSHLPEPEEPRASAPSREPSLAAGETAQTTKLAAPSPPPKSPTTAHHAQEEDDLREESDADSTRDDPSRYRWGIAWNVGTSTQFQEPGPTLDWPHTAVRARVGPRYVLHGRRKGSSSYVAVAGLVGADARYTPDGYRAAVGLDVRAEAGLMGTLRLAEPLAALFVQFGLDVPVAQEAAEFHAGVGFLLDLMASGFTDWKRLGLGGELRGLGTAAGLVVGAAFVAQFFLGQIATLFAGAVVVAAVFGVAVLMTPAVELRYTVRADGTSFGSLLLGCGF